jgi:3-hydroxy-3-methylglutaryl CoA synthase
MKDSGLTTPHKVYGITGYGAYVPRLRLARAHIAAAHRWMAPGLKAQAAGHRAHCSWDEDSVTMAVEAARDALASHPNGFVRSLRSLTFLTATPHCTELQNGAIAADALALPATARTLEVAASHRALCATLDAALEAPSGAPALLIASDRPRAKPASPQEIGQGAGAAAFTLGTERVIAQRLGGASRHAMFVDHFRAEGSAFETWWEERWIRDEGYLKLLVETVTEALANAGVAAGAVDHFILPTPFKGAAAAVAKKLGLRPEAESPTLAESCGFAGPAHAGLMLAEVLGRALPGQLIVLAGFGQGADALVLRTTAAISAAHPPLGVAGALAQGLAHDAYLRLASFEGSFAPDWGMRGEKAVKTALTEQYRSTAQLAGFVAGRCAACSTVQFPQLPYCLTPGCNAPRAQFTPHPLVDEAAQVLTYTADWATFHLAPPLYVGFVQFASGARVLMEMADVGPEGPEVGMPMRVVCRIKDVDRQRGYPRYFWKATPASPSDNSPSNKSVSPSAIASAAPSASLTAHTSTGA